MPKPVRKSSKIRLFRKIPVSRIKNPDPRFVYLENERYGIKVPLQNGKGLLQGVFETRKGETIELRFDPLENYYYVFTIDTGREVGLVAGELSDRWIEPEYRNRGIATEVFDRAEPHQPELHLLTAKRDTAAFLLQRGYKPETPSERKELHRLNIGRKEPNIEIGNSFWFVKPTIRSKFANPAEWHRIKVIGQHGKAKGKPIWLTIRALLVHPVP
jgi:GNAT superfamily N-acetyltransferase